MKPPWQSLRRDDSRRRVNSSCFPILGMAILRGCTPDVFRKSGKYRVNLRGYCDLEPSARVSSLQKAPPAVLYVPRRSLPAHRSPSARGELCVVRLPEGCVSAFRIPVAAFSRCQVARSARRPQPSCILDTCAHLRRQGRLLRLAWARPLTFHTLCRDFLRLSIP